MTLLSPLFLPLNMLFKVRLLVLELLPLPDESLLLLLVLLQTLPPVLDLLPLLHQPLPLLPLQPLLLGGPPGLLQLAALLLEAEPLLLQLLLALVPPPGSPPPLAGVALAAGAPLAAVRVGLNLLEN